MKKNVITLFPLALLMFFSCQQPPSGPAVDLSSYPKDLVKVLDAHGGLATWRKMQALTFEVVKETGNETHTVDLHKRWDKVETPTYQLGYDGTEIWLKADTSFKGNAAFTHNLMFYFFAMPFVLADDGIIYSDADTLTYKGIAYPGIKIAYNEGVGSSSHDEYILHYDPETYEMTWLAYTATFFVQERRSNFRWIHYQDWTTVEGISLPTKLTWFKVNGQNFFTMGSEREFDAIELSAKPHDPAVFARPEGAEVVE